jgi:hypothetical protein
MWYNRELVVFRIQYFWFLCSARCIRIWSDLTIFLCVRCHNIYFLVCISFFVSVG